VMKKKTRYRIRNWKEYNRSLRERGSLTFWMSKGLLANWLEREKTGERGRPPVYTEAAIRAMMQIRFVFHQAGRQTCGFVSSVFKMMRVALPVPDHSTLSRRMGGVDIRLPVKSKTKPRHIVCDSTGVKVYGEGEWKVRQHGYTKRRTWLKLHFQADEATGEIIVAGASTNSVSDGEMFVEMIGMNTEDIEQISGDGAFDQRKVYSAIGHCGVKRVAIPPQSNARIWQHGNSKEKPLARDQNLRSIRRLGKAKWKQKSNYHRRSLAETEVFRFKTIFSDKLQSRQIDNQFQEMFIKCAALNRMTHLGMPDSYKIAA